MRSALQVGSFVRAFAHSRCASSKFRLFSACFTPTLLSASPKLNLPIRFSTAMSNQENSALVVENPPVMDDFNVQFPAHREGEGGRFGLELTFTDDTFIELARQENGEEYKKHFEGKLHALIASIRNRFPSAQISPISLDKHSYSQVVVTLPVGDDGLQLFIHSDDWVIEVGSSPLTSKDLARHESVLQNALFDAAADVGIKPHPRVGGGHLHLEYSSHFGGDAVLLRNFIVDLCNRPLLFLGALNTDLLNAPPLAILPASQQQAFIEVLTEFDALPTEQKNTAALKDAINAKVYCKSYIQRDVDELSSYNKKQHKYHAINLLHKHTVEVRGFRPQPSARVLLREMQLLEGRLNKLRGQPLIGYNPQVCTFEEHPNLSHLVSWSVDRHMESYSVDIDKESIQQSLRDYVNDAGLDSADFPFDQIFL